MALSERSYSKYKMTDIHEESHEETRGSGDNEYTVTVWEWVYNLDTELSAESSTKTVDWRNWVGNGTLQNLVMYGNKINFRYFIGERSITLGQAVERGILTESMIEFEARSTTSNQYISNSAFDSLDEAEKKRILEVFTKRGYSTSLNTSTGKWHLPGYSSSSASQEIKDYVSRYFPLTPYTTYKDISDFVNGEWRDESFQSTSRNSETTADFKIRMGSKLWSTDGDEFDSGRSRFVIHRKHKGKAGIWGLLSKESTGTLTLLDIEGASKNMTLSYMRYANGTGMSSIDYDADYILNGYFLVSSEGTSNAVNRSSINNVRNKLLNFRLYDEWTQSAPHNGTAIVFPFGY